MIFFVKSTVYHHIKKFLNGIKNNEGYDRILTNTVCSEVKYFSFYIQLLEKLFLSLIVIPFYIFVVLLLLLFLV